jgi:phage pi2 protein 07
MNFLQDPSQELQERDDRGEFKQPVGLSVLPRGIYDIADVKKVRYLFLVKLLDEINTIVFQVYVPARQFSKEMEKLGFLYIPEYKKFQRYNFNTGKMMTIDTWFIQFINNGEQTSKNGRKYYSFSLENMN